MKRVAAADTTGCYRNPYQAPLSTPAAAAPTHTSTGGTGFEGKDGPAQRQRRRSTNDDGAPAAPLVSLRWRRGRNLVTPSASARGERNRPRYILEAEVCSKILPAEAVKKNKRTGRAAKGAQGYNAAQRPERHARGAKTHQNNMRSVEFWPWPTRPTGGGYTVSARAHQCIFVCL
jgi:hypothetical protein